MITSAGLSDVGRKRKSNEDSFAISEDGTLLVVADGMGGHAAGEVASTMAVESISADLEAGEPTTQERYARRLRRAIETANEKINAQSRLNQSERGMGTTCTALVIRGADAFLAHVGDSRAYLAQGGRIRQLTQPLRDTSPMPVTRGWQRTRGEASIASPTSKQCSSK